MNGKDTTIIPTFNAKKVNTLMKHIWISIHRQIQIDYHAYIALHHRTEKKIQGVMDLQQYF